MADWMRRVKSADVSRFPALMDEFTERATEDGAFAELEAARAWLFSRWIEKDLADAVEFVASRKGDQVALGRQFGWVLGEMDAGQALEVLAGPLAGSMGGFFVKSVLRSMATNWPREFLAMNMESTAKEWKSSLPYALRALAAEDPRAAAEAWTSQGEGLQWAAAAIIEAWGGKNPAEARGWVESLEDPAARLAGRHAWLNGLAKQDPQAALRGLLEMRADFEVNKSGSFVAEAKYPDGRTEVIRALAKQSAGAALEGWKAMKAAGLLPNLKGADFSPEGNIIQAISEVLARKLPGDPAPLMKALQALFPVDPDADAGDRERILSVRKGIWDQKFTSFSSASALEAARLLSNADPKTFAWLISKCIGRVASHDPSEVGPLLAALPEMQRGDIASKAMRGLQRDQMAARQAIMAGVPPGDWRPQFGNMLAAKPEANADLIASLPDTAEASMARSDFAGNWGRADPAAAGRWVAGLPATAGSTQAARGLMEAWGSYDEIAASTWANILPPGPVRDGAALGLAASLSALDPDAGWRWAASIGDPVLRVDAMFNVATKWGDEAPPEFRTALSTALDGGGYRGAAKKQMLSALDEPSANARQLTPATDK